MEYIPIDELKPRLNQVIDSFYAIKTIQLRQARSGREYADLMLSDASATVSAKIWELDEHIRAMAPGDVIKVRAMVEDYQGTLQLNIRMARLSMPADNVDMARLVPAAPQSGEEMYALAMEYAARITRPGLRQLVQTMWEERRDSLMIAPAAVVMHHSVRSGLLMHITGMLRAAEGILAAYPALDGDFLFAGVLLHDIAKLDEMQIGPMGLATDYTPDGQLFGHITLGVLAAEETGRRLGTPEEELRLIKHMILSHHEVPEYGSPRPPMTPEAEVLQTLDKLDARLYDHYHALRFVEPGGFSDKVFSMDKRRIYRPAQP
nr:HD domain-containing protein [bacterium]